MIPEAQFSQNLKTHNVLVALAALIMSVSGSAATTDEQALYIHQYILLEHYKLIYTEEIFDFCIEKSGTPRRLVMASKLGSCLRKNNKLKQRILNNAHEQLGRQSLAQSIYDECLDYHPMVGVRPIGKCVYTKLYLHRELNDDSEERRVYQKCNLKWRKHGYGAVDTCAKSEVNYYRRWGKYNDE